MSDGAHWAPQPGPQTVFARCTADIAFFGGAAGGGKSFALLYDAVKWTAAAGVLGYRGILFRRTSPELVGGGGLWDESQALYRAFGGRPRGAPTLDWTFEASSGDLAGRHRIEFRHLVHETTVHEHQGRQYAFVGFDEVTHFTARQFWYLVSRLRSKSGVKPRIRATCNPDPDSWVAELIAWWIGDDGYPILERSGVIRWFVRIDDDLEWYDSRADAIAAHPEALPMSLTFIASRLKDNPALTSADPAYRAKLMSLSRVERDRLLGDEDRGGNWHVRESAGLFFRRDDFVLAASPPSPIVRTVRAWDKAGSVPTPKLPQPDWTRGVRVSRCEGGEYWIDDVVSVQARPTDVLRLMRETAHADGHEVTQVLWKDPGQAGVLDVEVTSTVLGGYDVQTLESWSASREPAANVKHRSSPTKRAHARSWAQLVEQGRIHVAPREWTAALVSECNAFPDGRHDDFVDAISAAMRVLQSDDGNRLLMLLEAV